MRAEWDRLIGAMDAECYAQFLRFIGNEADPLPTDEPGASREHTFWVLIDNALVFDATALRPWMCQWPRSARATASAGASIWWIGAACRHAPLRQRSFPAPTICTSSATGYSMPGCSTIDGDLQGGLGDPAGEGQGCRSCFPAMQTGRLLIHLLIILI